MRWGLIPPWASDPKIGALLTRREKEDLAINPVGNFVNSSRNDSPRCIEPVVSNRDNNSGRPSS